MLRRTQTSAVLSRWETDSTRTMCSVLWQKETIAQLLTENNVENFIYVMFSAQSKTNKTRLCKQNSSRWGAASPFNKLNGWEQCFKSFSSSPYICVNISFLYRISRDKDSISDIFWKMWETSGFKFYMMKRKTRKKRACKYAYNVTYFNIHNKKFFFNI